MSGQWWESDLIVGPFANMAEANAWAVANPNSLFPGLLATSNGQQISWGGAGVGWGEEITQRIKRLSANAVYPETPAIASTITVGAQDGTTQISGGVSIAKDDPRIRYGSDMVQAGATYPNSLSIRGQSVNYGAWSVQSGRYDNRTCPEFFTDAISVEFQIRANGSNKYRIYYMEPGDIWRIAGDVSTVPNDGYFYRVKITFSAGGVARRVRIESASEALWTEFVISPTGMLWAVPPTDIRAIILGDSFTEGDAAISGVFGSMDNWAARLGWMMGWGDTWLSGVGSTGYITAPDGKLKLADRIATDIGNYAPDVIVIADGLNDFGATASAVEIEAESTLAKIRAITNAPVFVLGAWNPKSVDVSSINEGIKAAAAKFSGVYYVGDTWFNGTGRRGQLANNGNSDFYVGEDGSHPTLLGHKYLALRAREAILAALG